jgi:uncharacterized protein YndB with AHSA1/START domain
MTHNIRLEWLHPQSPSAVWHLLTDPALIAEWLMKNDFRPVVGHRFQFSAEPMPGWCGVVDCEVLTVDEPRKLAYSWVSGPKLGDRDVDTVVTWTLVPENGGTRLILEHTGFEGEKGLHTSTMLGNGWKGKIGRTIGELLQREYGHGQGS